MFDVERIVVAVDGSDCSLRAAEVAGDIAALFGGEVLVVHLDETIAAWGVATVAETPGEAFDLADGVVRVLKDRGVSARAEVRECVRGGVGDVIVAIADGEDADLVVMGSRGLGRVSALLLGSVAHTVLHQASVPVLIVK